MPKLRCGNAVHGLWNAAFCGGALSSSETAAEVEVDLTESAMVPAAAAGMLLWLIPALVYP